jgi:HEAT repeat protein
VATDATAVPDLIEVMENGSQVARLEAARALSEIGDTRAIPVLFKALEEGSVVLEYWASEGLEKMGVGMTFFEP